MLISLREFYGLTEKGGNNPKKWYGMIFSFFVFLFFFLRSVIPISNVFIYVILAFAFISFALELLRKSNAIKNLSAEFLGVFYVSIPFTLTNYIVFYYGDFDFRLLLGIFVLIWAYDIFAYFIGSSFGKKKIFPDISPNKSLEGTVGGILISILSGFIIFKILNILSLLDWMLLGLIVSLGALIGDLIESKLKRSAGVKDSGKIMPGHGGLLDRFDSFLFAVVGAFIYLIFIKYFF